MKRLIFLLAFVVLGSCGERQDFILPKLVGFRPGVTTCRDAATAFGFTPSSEKVLADGKRVETWRQANPDDLSQQAEVSIEFDESCVMTSVVSESLTASGTQL